MTSPQKSANFWGDIAQRFLPFADAGTQELPLGRLMRLSLFQVSVGMAVVLLNGTLNRVMIVELGLPTWLVATMVSLPLLFAPFRALIGFRSDTHRSHLGWRRVPFMWMGTLVQFGGLAIMPFSLLLMSGDGRAAVPYAGEAAAALAFLLVGYGLHTTQTAGLALATDLAPKASRPRVVALLYVTLLLGMGASAVLFGFLLQDFDQLRLIKVIQGAGIATMLINLLAMYKQEPRDPTRTRFDAPQPSFRESWNKFIQGGRASRLLVAVGLGTAGFSMQDILLEPYGGEILRLTVAETTHLTALLAFGSLGGFAWAARALGKGWDPYAIAGLGALAGIFAFSAVVFAAPLNSALLFRIGTLFIGFGAGLFAVGTLTAAMELAESGDSGLALGAWGAVQATATGVAIAFGGGLRDAITNLATQGTLGPALTGPVAGYSVVYHLEIGLLFATLVAVGPLVRLGGAERRPPSRFGLAELPG